VVLGPGETTDELRALIAELEPKLDAHQVAFGRVVVSEIEPPKLFANPVQRG
jgi:hypothetical protein